MFLFKFYCIIRFHKSLKILQYPSFSNRYLRPGGYPVVNADGGSFPENMKIFGDMVTHNLTFDPLEGRANLVINSPLPDDWFMLAHTNRRQEDEEMGFVQRVSFYSIENLHIHISLNNCK